MLFTKADVKGMALNLERDNVGVVIFGQIVVLCRVIWWCAHRTLLMFR